MRGIGLKMFEKLTAYEVIEHYRANELDSDVTLLKHKKTGARIVTLSNTDPNKVFYIGFRTPPADSTGVAHIIEHTVLCGSEKYPVKDPFIELVKGSLNTFLNAMTYPDKTLYPVASCNDKDFQNLMDVYLDAVFHPNIYKEEKIFLQEGWHYELEDKDAPLKINGVVYNEMKGAFSSPDDVLDREIMNSLYPDTSYSVESGGDPEVIPELTYEQFLDFHRTYYHPSNSYLYLYGDMDLQEKLEYIDKEYLSTYDYLHIDSEIRMQQAFEERKEVIKEYSIMDNEAEEENAYLTYNVSIGDNLDPEKYIAYQILDYAVCSAPGAVLKQALINAGIGVDVYSNYENGIRQPFFSIVAKGADLADKDRFIAIIESELRKMTEEGIAQRALDAALTYYEFKYREADFGSYPKGLMWGLQIMDSWLYDEQKPLLHLKVNHIYQALREKLGTDYYKDLLADGILNNTHKTIVCLKPVKGLTGKKEKELENRLQALKDTMTEQKVLQIVMQTKELKDYQEQEDSPELLAKIPLLSREDIGKKAAEYINAERFVDDTLILHHDIFTNDVGYLRFIFDLSKVPNDLYPYIGILKSFLGLLDTKHYGYGDLFNQIHIVTGGIVPLVNTYKNAENPTEYKATFEIKAKTFYNHIADTFEIIKEMLLTTDFSDEKRLLELLEETKSHVQANLISAGHSTAALRALAYSSETAYISSLMSGVPYYRLLVELTDSFAEKKQTLISALNELVHMIFRRENLMIDFTGTEEGYELVASQTNAFVTDLFSDAVRTGRFLYEPEKKNEGFMSAAQVQYVCRAGDFSKKGLAYTGALKVLKVMLGYDYLWTQVRVKGGAYGCMCTFAKSGESYFVSYRDPNLSDTISVYEKAADYLRAYKADERTVTQYIIGAISELDIPMTAQGKGVYSLSGYLSHYPVEKVQKERDEILSVTEDTFRELADYVEAFMECGQMCVVGGEAAIRENETLFGTIEELIR